MQILVLGGNGFIGKNIVASLRAQGASVKVGGRFVQNDHENTPIKLHTMLRAEDWKNVLNQVDIVINAVGILRQRRGTNGVETYDKIHNLAVRALAIACKTQGVRLMHISTFGLNANAKSGFIRSKYAGEQAILNSGAQANIVRTSILDGEGGYGAKWFRRVATWPIQLVMRTDGLVAPMQVADLAEAVAKITQLPADSLPKIIELGGSEMITIAQYLKVLRQAYGKPAALQIVVPQWLVRLVSHVLDLLAWTPLSFGHFELMQGKNVPIINQLPMIIGREPTALGVKYTSPINDAFNDILQVVK